MKIELGTEKLKSAVAKVYKGVGDANIYVTTQIVGIEGKDGNIILSTTDRVANIKVTLRDVISKDISFYTNTKAELFKKLLDRTQSATVELDIQDNKIVFSGSGDANLEIIYNDEDGEGALVRIKDIPVTGEPKQVKTSDLKKFVTYLKGTLPTSIDNPVYTGYRVFDNKAMTYNNFGANLIEIGWNDDILLPKSVVDLFDTIDGDTVEVTVDDENIKFVGGDVEISGKLKSDVEDYTTDRFTNLFYSKDIFTKETVIDRVRLLSALDRINLFIGKEDSGIFSIELDDKNVVLITLARNCVESIALDSCSNPNEISKNIGMPVLETALSAVKGDKIHIDFGEKVGLRIYDEVGKAYLLVPYARIKKEKSE